MAEASINAGHVNPFIKATMETFKTMVNMKVTPGKIILKDKSSLPHDVSGIIGLSGGAKGSVALSFPRMSAMAIARSFIGETTIDSNQMADAIGELANIVAGVAKRDLSQYKINISLPSVIMGDNHAIAGPVDSINLIVPFDCEGGRFDLAICFKSQVYAA